MQKRLLVALAILAAGGSTQAKVNKLAVTGCVVGGGVAAFGVYALLKPEKVAAMFNISEATVKKVAIGLAASGTLLGGYSTASFLFKNGLPLLRKGEEVAPLTGDGLEKFNSLRALAKAEKVNVGDDLLRVMVTEGLVAFDGNKVNDSVKKAELETAKGKAEKIVEVRGKTELEGTEVLKLVVADHKKETKLVEAARKLQIAEIKKNGKKLDDADLARALSAHVAYTEFQAAELGKYKALVTEAAVGDLTKVAATRGNADLGAAIQGALAYPPKVGQDQVINGGRLVQDVTVAQLTAIGVAKGTVGDK